MERVLVVDDDAMVSDVVRRYLERAGYAVTLADDGRSALERFREQRPDLVVLDHMLPGIDGLARDWLGPTAAQPRWIDAASATRHLDRSDPPGFVVHGDLDDVVPASQMMALVHAAGRAGVTTGLFWDRVGSGSPACRGHLPQCGMNASALDTWMDRVVAGTL